MVAGLNLLKDVNPPYYMTINHNWRPQGHFLNVKRITSVHVAFILLNIHHFRLCFFFSIFPFSNSRSCVCCPCWWKCKLADVVRTEWDRSDYSVCRPSRFVLHSHFPICSINVMCLQLNYFNFANLIQLNKCTTVTESFSSTCFYTNGRSGNKLFKILFKVTLACCLFFASINKISTKRLFFGKSNIFLTQSS